MPRISRGPASERTEKNLAFLHRLVLGVIFLLFLLIAIALEFLVMPMMEGLDPRWRSAVSTLAGSLVMAVILGFTFEILLAHLRDRTFESLFERHFAMHREVVFGRLEAFSVLSLGGLFELLESIARQTTELPTLYPQPRVIGSKEFTFAGDYLDKLVQSRPQETVAILRSRWIRADAHPHVKFLAADFVGYFQLCELKSELLSLSRQRIKDVEASASKGEITGNDAWALNYVWAASRCPSNPKRIYQELGDLLCATSSRGVQRWILFVPRQMPHLRFLELIDAFLKANANRAIDTDVLIETIESLAFLERMDIRSRRWSARTVIENNARMFVLDVLRQKIDEEWASLSANTKPEIPSQT